MTSTKDWFPRFLLGLVLWGLAITAGWTADSIPRKSPLPAASPAGDSRSVDTIQAEDVRPHVDYLAGPELRGRGNELGKTLAASYIVDAWKKAGLKPLFAHDSYRQEIPGDPEEGEPPAPRGINLGAWLPGNDPARKDEVIIVSAHYDHLVARGETYFPGADDNASGVAMLLEVSRQMAAGPAPARSVAFLSCDLEEQGLFGAQWFVAHPPWPLKQVKLFVVADMIGRSLGDLPLKTVFVLGTERGTGLRELVTAVQKPNQTQLSLLGADLVGTRSDYGPFRDHKVPFLFFSSGQHPDYHTPGDVPRLVNAQQVAEVSEAILGLTRRAADAAEAPQWIAKPEPDLEEVRTLERITGLLLDRDAEAGPTDKLSDVQRFMVSNVRTKAKQIIVRGTVLPDDRPWLVRNAQMLLMTVF